MGKFRKGLKVFSCREVEFVGHYDTPEAFLQLCDSQSCCNFCSHYGFINASGRTKNHKLQKSSKKTFISTLETSNAGPRLGVAWYSLVVSSVYIRLALSDLFSHIPVGFSAKKGLGLYQERPGTVMVFRRHFFPVG